MPAVALSALFVWGSLTISAFPSSEAYEDARFLRHCHVLNLRGDSYRLKMKKVKATGKEVKLN
jgi:hypothetical protein